MYHGARIYSTTRTTSILPSQALQVLTPLPLTFNRNPLLSNAFTLRRRARVWFMPKHRKPIVESVREAQSGWSRRSALGERRCGLCQGCESGDSVLLRTFGSSCVVALLSASPLSLTLRATHYRSTLRSSRRARGISSASRSRSMSTYTCFSKDF